MKILICGVPKSGKTTLCKQIEKEFPSFNIISGEALRNGFQKMDKGIIKNGEISLANKEKKISLHF